MNMNAFPTDNDIQIAVDLLINKYGVTQSMLVKLIGSENLARMNDVLSTFDKRLDLYKLAKMIVISNGPYLFAGRDSAVRDLRTFLLKQLDDVKLIELYERNKIDGKNIKSPSHMPNALARKKWVMGKRWARDFVQTLDFPIVFSGVAIPQNYGSEPFQDVEPKKTLPPLVDYQYELKERMLGVLNKEGEKTRCVVTLPTGGGKTRVAVESFIEWMLPRFSEGKYLLWIAQGEELCEQAIACIADMWKEREFTEALRIYRYFGGKQLNQDNMIGGAVVASIQQLYTRVQNNDPIIDEILKNCGAVIIDEAHHAVAYSYQVIFERARELVGEDLYPICGLTATPGRSNGETVNLVNQFEAYLIHPTLPDVEKYKINPLLYFREKGYLAEPIFLLIEDGEVIEVTDEMMDEQEEDLNVEFLRKLAADHKRNQQIIQYLKTIPKGSSTLVYACTVEHAKFLAMVLNSIGRKSAVITSHTHKQIRRSHIEAFKHGEIEFLLNYGVLTTGFDAPKTDHIIICRPTSSIVLYEQMVGRGLRGIKFNGTKQCYIVDFSQNIKRHGRPLAYARFLKDWQVRTVSSFEEVTT